MYEQIIALLDQRRLKEALVQLSVSASASEDWKLKTDIENLSTTYNYMLQYAAQGSDDPGRGKMYHSLCRTAYELADKTHFVTKNRKDSGYFAGKYRLLQLNQTHTYAELIDMLVQINADIAMSELSRSAEGTVPEVKKLYVRRGKVLDELFDKIWTSAQWTEEEYRQVNDILDHCGLPTFDLAVIMSAMTLNAMNVFDCRKFRFLIDACQSGLETPLTLRALAGITLIAYYQEKRLFLYPDLLAAISLLGESKKVVRDMLVIQTTLLLSRETEKINKKMREEIIPQIMRNPGMMHPDLKIFEIDEQEDKNPEWNKDMAHIEKDLHELGELQLEGADTYMGTFAQMKHYPFFREASHWFYLFDKQTPEMSELFSIEHPEMQGTIIDILMDATFFCNSDKYSFCLSLSNMPAQQRQLIMTQLSVQSEIMKENMEYLKNNTKDKDDPKAVARQYVHDLYRFYKLWAYRNEEHDIFKDKLDLWNCNALAPLLNTPETLRHIADHLFSKDYMEEASVLYQKLARSGQPDAEILQKLGFTYQKMKNYPEAIKAYDQADLLKPDHIWTLKHLAQCYKRTQQYQQAIEYYEKVKEMKPDDLNVLLQLGQCLATLRQYDKALTHFFKVEYLDKAPANARRAIGWCYFMTGKYENALRFYRKLQETSDVQPTDWLNAGHVYLAMNNIPHALECYRKTETYYSSHEEFMRVYMTDRDALLEQGVTEECISIVPDML